jgi:hypothetical protein
VEPPVPASCRWGAVYAGGTQVDTGMRMSSWCAGSPPGVPPCSRWLEGPNSPGTLGVTGRCGSAHNPPNGRFEYDRFDPAPNPSDCPDWKARWSGRALADQLRDLRMRGSRRHRQPAVELHDLVDAEPPGPGQLDPLPRTSAAQLAGRVRQLGCRDGSRSVVDCPPARHHAPVGDGRRSPVRRGIGRDHLHRARDRRLVGYRRGQPDRAVRGRGESAAPAAGARRRQLLQPAELRAVHSFRDLIARPFRERGETLPDGARRLSATELLAVTVGLDAEPATIALVLRSVVEMDIEDDGAGGLTWRPVVTARTRAGDATLIGEAGLRAAAVAHRWLRPHVVRMHLRRRNPSPAKVAGYAAGLRAYGAWGRLKPELPPGCTWVQEYEAPGRMNAPS